jgi:hypothetical protein
MSNRKTDLAILVGLVAHEYGHAETRRMLANLSAALRHGDGPEALQERPQPESEPVQ